MNKVPVRWAQIVGSENIASNKQSRFTKLFVWTTTNLLNSQNGVSAAKDGNDNETPDLENQVVQPTKPIYLCTKRSGLFWFVGLFAPDCISKPIY